MSETTSTQLSPPRIVNGDALSIFGLSQHYRQSNVGMPAQWINFVPYLGKIVGQIGWMTYGVIYNADGAGNCDYICGVAVTDFPAHPLQFARLEIPPQRYAVFEHRSHISAISATWKAISEHGLAGAGCQAANGPAYERYGEQFDGRTGLGGLEIWMPVKADHNSHCRVEPVSLEFRGQPG